MKTGNITRKDLARLINEKMGFSCRSAAALVDAVFAALTETLLAGENVKLVHFGTFNLLDKSPRVGRNPQTGQTVEISRRKVVSFKASKELRGRINE